MSIVTDDIEIYGDFVKILNASYELLDDKFNATGLVNKSLITNIYHDCICTDKVIYTLNIPMDWNFDMSVSEFNNFVVSEIAILVSRK